MIAHFLKFLDWHRVDTFFFAMSVGHLFKGVGGSTQTMGPSPSFLQVQFLCGQVNNISSLMSHKENIFSMGH